MKCPKCGGELRQSTKDPDYGLCDICRKRYKWREETGSQKKTSSKSPSQKGPIISAAIIGFIILAIIYVLTPKKVDNTENNNSTPLPVYSLINQSDYVRDGEKCQGYRIVSDTNITNEEILSIYDEITHNDEYKYHTLWFYEDENDLTIPFATLDDEIKNDGKPSIDR